MKLSWSHKLFFQANRVLGRSAGLDAGIKFVAEYVLFLLGLAVFLALWQSSTHFKDFVFVGLRLGLVAIGGLGLSFGFASLWPHRRPKVEFPEIKELITPLSHWKSLPSDHSLLAWLLVWVFWSYTNLGLFADILVGVAATAIGFSRVLAGVHYPRDIIAGALLATGLAYLFF